MVKVGKHFFTVNKKRTRHDTRRRKNTSRQLFHTLQLQRHLTLFNSNIYKFSLFWLFRFLHFGRFALFHLSRPRCSCIGLTKTLNVLHKCFALFKFCYIWTVDVIVLENARSHPIHRLTHLAMFFFKLFWWNLTYFSGTLFEGTIHNGLQFRFDCIISWYCQCDIIKIYLFCRIVPKLIGVSKALVVATFGYVFHETVRRTLMTLIPRISQWKNFTAFLHYRKVDLCLRICAIWIPAGLKDGENTWWIN